MRGGIHGKAMHHRLDRKTFELTEVTRIVLLIHANHSAGTGGVNTARIEFDDIGSPGRAAGAQWRDVNPGRTRLGLYCRHRAEMPGDVPSPLPSRGCLGTLPPDTGRPRYP